MMDRRALLATGASLLAASEGGRRKRSKPTQAEELLVQNGIGVIVVAIGRKELAATELIDVAERRIGEYDETYGAVIEMNPDAMALATELDQLHAQRTPRGPLHGVPVLLKDIIATGDRMRTTAGSLALAENEVVEDAAIVKRLRDAGAVILGKTNMTEWSNIRHPGQTAGWSDRGGQTRNPYDPMMSTWGSSSGSAAAVALGYAPAALGVETNGSILCPAAACGVVGFKPTVGLVSRVGVMSVTWTLDSPGPITRSVSDVAIMMNVLAGHDPEDPAYGIFRWASPVSTSSDGFVHAYDAVDYTQALDPDALKGARLGICWQLWGMDPEADAVGYEVVDRLRVAGAEIVEDVWIPTLEEMSLEPGVGTIVNTEFAYGMASFFERYMPDGPVGSIQEIVEWNLEHADEVFRYGGQDWLYPAIAPVPMDDPYYLGMVQWLITKARGEGMDVALDTHGVDAIIAPTAALPTEIAIGGGTNFAGSSALGASFAGYPSITVPMGHVRGLPVGLHLSGRPFAEQTLIRLAYSIEQLLQIDAPPQPQSRPVNETSEPIRT